MKNKIKLLSIVLIVTFCLSLCTITTNAVTATVNKIGEPIAETVPVATDPPVETEPVATQEPTQTPTQEPTQAPTQQITQEPTQPITQPPTQAPTERPTQQETVNRPTRETTPAPNVDSTTPVVQNDNSQSATHSVYDVDGDVDTDNLNKKDWDELKDMLDGADGKGSAGGDFDFIQKNTRSGDNGLWILIVGIVCVVAGIGIIVAVIYFSKKKKKMLDAGNFESDSKKQEKKTTSQEKRQINKRSKYDTDEVYISREKTRGGTRYKPRH